MTNGTDEGGDAGGEQDEMWEAAPRIGLQERIPEPLIGLERSHDKWERMREGMREGMQEGMRERIPEPLIGSDRSHDLASTPA